MMKKPVMPATDVNTRTGYLCQSAADHDQSLWYGRIVRLMKIMGHVEPSDALWRDIEADLGACTKAYLAKDVRRWRWHALRVEARVHLTEGPLECLPTWC